MRLKAGHRMRWELKPDGDDFKLVAKPLKRKPNKEDN
tara:strand:+ start:189 stop:299 length:111 start_codon:yes stop_codon:yes gene_type:complete